MFNFPSVEAFLAGTANAFNITLGERRSVIDQRAMALFVQDHITVHDTVTLELGTALRVARHAHGAGRPVRRLRRGERVASARRRRRRRDLPAEQPERRAARRRGLESLTLTVARSCAQPMAGPWTSRARRRSGTRPAIRRSPRRSRPPARSHSPARSTRRGPPGSPRRRSIPGSGTRRCSRGT